MSTTAQQEATHKSAVALAEAARQTAQAAARLAYSGLAAGWPAYDAAIKAADVVYMRALIASYQLNGLGMGPSRTLHELIGQDS
jgi:hypothetical protein